MVASPVTITEEVKLKENHEKYPCDLSSLMPRTFGSYLLPAFNIPVYYREEEIGRIDIPVSGALEINIPKDVCSQLHKGSLFVKPVTEVVTADSIHRFLIVGIVLADMF